MDDCCLTGESTDGSPRVNETYTCMLLVYPPEIYFIWGAVNFDDGDTHTKPHSWCEILKVIVEMTS